MTIEGLGKKFQEARRARDLTLDEAARMTKIRPSRLAEIEADDFSQFPSLAYAKGFLLIYGKFLDVDVTPYLDAFEDSERVTVDGYSYLQDNPPPKDQSVLRSLGAAPLPSQRPRLADATHHWRPRFGNRLFGNEIHSQFAAACAGASGACRPNLPERRVHPELHNSTASDRRNAGKQCCVGSCDCATGFAHADSRANSDRRFGGSRSAR